MERIPNLGKEVTKAVVATKRHSRNNTMIVPVVLTVPVSSVRWQLRDTSLIANCHKRRMLCVQALSSTTKGDDIYVFHIDLFKLLERAFCYFSSF